MIELHDAHYEMDMGCNLDVWRLKGIVYNHPNYPDGQMIGPSTPVTFDPITNVMVTASGKVYRIMSYIKMDEVVAQIQTDIVKGGYGTQ